MRSGRTSYSSVRGAFRILPALLALASVANAQEPASWKLSEIEFTGLQRCSRQKAVEVSGLFVGEKVNLGAFEAATRRLSKSGFFRRVNYRYSYTAEAATVSFEVEEAKWLPVVYDNFVWLADPDITAAVKRDDPSFDGTAPAYGEVLERIKKTLESMLTAKGVSCTVEYISSFMPGGGQEGTVFRAAGVKLPLCAVQFPNATAVRETELLKVAKPLLASDYSRIFVEDFAAANLLPVYRERGYLRARFLAPEISLSSDAGCKNGVSIKLPMSEDARFNFDGVEWAGNSSLSIQELDGILEMKQGDIANGVKIDAGFKAVRTAYGKRGFIFCRVTPAPSFDAQKHLAAYRVTIDEGPQFKMGTLSFSGFNESEAAGLRKKWKLETGQVYDASYVSEFADKTLLGFGAAVQNITYSVRPDRERLQVDVTINLRR